MWPRADSRAQLGQMQSQAPLFGAAGVRQAAVIDIGSNSVRLVIYRREGRAIWTVYNEKALAGLGRDLTVTGRLSPQGVETALVALPRSRAPLRGGNGGDLFVAPPPAGRAAADGPAFIRKVEDEAGLIIRVLTGA